MSLDEQVLIRNPSLAPEAAVRSIFSHLKDTAGEPRRIALVGTFTPRKCGIATFATDVFEKLAEFHPHIAVDIYALDDPRDPLEYQGIAGTIAYDDPEAYLAAARRINESGVDAVDAALGTPAHALVVARSEGHSNIYVLTGEEVPMAHPATDALLAAVGGARSPLGASVPRDADTRRTPVDRIVL